MEWIVLVIAMKEVEVEVGEGWQKVVLKIGMVLDIDIVVSDEIPFFFLKKKNGYRYEFGIFFIY